MPGRVVAGESAHNSAMSSTPLAATAVTMPERVMGSSPSSVPGKPPMRA